MDTGIGIALGGFFLSLSSIVAMVLTFRKGAANDYYIQLEKRVSICEEDRKQLHAEINQLRQHNFWLTQRLTVAGKLENTERGQHDN